MKIKKQVLSDDQKVPYHFDGDAVIKKIFSKDEIDCLYQAAIENKIVNVRSIDAYDKGNNPAKSNTNTCHIFSGKYTISPVGRGIAAVFLLVLVSTAYAQSSRNLMGKYSLEFLQANVNTRASWKPFPIEGKFWQNNLPDTLLRTIIRDGEKAAGEPLKMVEATLWLEYTRKGLAINFRDVAFALRIQLFDLLRAEVVESKGRFTEPIANIIWALCEQSYWGLPAHLIFQKEGFGLPDVEDVTVDLLVAETAALLSFCDYFLGAQLDSISPLLRRRIYFEVNRRMLLPLETQPERYFYLGSGRRDAKVNNWNPWVISNWITANLLLEKNELRRVTTLHRAMGFLDLYFNSLGRDGSIDEGPMYWFAAGGCAFDVLALIHNVTNGKVNVFDEPLVKDMSAYIYKTHIDDKYFINVADSDPKVYVDGLMLYRFGKMTGDATLKNFGSWAVPVFGYQGKTDHRFFSSSRGWFNLAILKEAIGSKGAPPAIADFWMPEVQLMGARSTNGFYLAAHGGHNAESHNHNDVGDFIVYYRGQPVIVDVGCGEYTAKTFSKDRYTLWYNNSDFHNLPRINGKNQCDGHLFAAKNVVYEKQKNSVFFQTDIAGAYPLEAKVTKWVRTINFKNRKEISLHDEYEIKGQLDSLSQFFITPCSININTAGKIYFLLPDQSRITLTYNPLSWKVRTEKITLIKPDEIRIAKNWPDGLTRIVLEMTNKKTKGVFKYTLTRE